ncbi:Pectinesterase 11-like protein [Theobroma cacao]|uniref:pectinesterase n=1 Tax=Theobroma cacao TaxID=3641 RepID=A0A061GZH7_THECC|nr:Pectinesterase 11-like protein [Theobroma cacao]
MAPSYSIYTCIFLLSLLMIMFMASSRPIDAAEIPAAILIRVDPSGKGDYRKIQDAIDAVPSNNKEVVFILVKPGIYKEKIVNIFESPTFSVLASDFVARYLTIQNTHGAGAKAVALRVSRDRAAFFGSRILFYQDTLLDDTERHYYSSCYIEGAVDFICGMPLLFLRGAICIHPRKEMQLSQPNAGSHLLRTQALLSWVVVFALTYMSHAILAQGWDDRGDSSKQSSVLYRGYKCYGPGANTKKRVEWSRELTGEEAQPCLTKNMIGGKIGSNQRQPVSRKLQLPNLTIPLGMPNHEDLKKARSAFVGRERMEMVKTVQGLLGKLGRHCYAVLCVSLILVSVTIAHMVYAMQDQPKDARERTKRRLRSLHGPFS